MQKIKIDPDDLDLDELEELDELLDGGFAGVMKGNGIPVKAMRVIAYLMLRREDPEVTLESCGKLKLSQFDLSDDPGEDGAAAT